MEETGGGSGTLGEKISYPESSIFGRRIAGLVYGVIGEDESS
jgi:hypothetical protein